MVDCRSVLLVCIVCNNWQSVSTPSLFWVQWSWFVGTSFTEFSLLRWNFIHHLVCLMNYNFKKYTVIQISLGCLFVAGSLWLNGTQSINSPKEFYRFHNIWIYTWHRTQNSCWHVTYVSGRTLGDQEGLYSPLLEIGVPVSAVSGLHFVFFRKMSQCLPCQMDSPKQEKRICNVYLLFYTEERWKLSLFTVKK